MYNHLYFLNFVGFDQIFGPIALASTGSNPDTCVNNILSRSTVITSGD